MPTDHKKYRSHPRDDEQTKKMKNRLHRIIGQLNGIENMLDDDRYCGDVLTQVAAVEKALQSFGYNLLSEHLKSCVTEEVKEGNEEIMDEVMYLVQHLK